MQATFDHGEIEGDRVRSEYESAEGVLDALGAIGISYDEVTALLEKEGVDKFVVSWNELLDTVTAALEAAK
jgi:transaldolase